MNTCRMQMIKDGITSLYTHVPEISMSFLLHYKHKNQDAIFLFPTVC